MLLKRNFIFIIMATILLVLWSEFAFAHGMSESEKQSILEGGNLQYLWLGATHMLSGYDHLAFVFGIIFFLTTFKDIARYVTAFTLGHSVTLIYATFNAIQLNYFIIDAVIALSVCYIAFANIDGFRKYLNVNPPNMLLMITSLGLIHGFGLSTRLQELPLTEDHLLLNIISFNVGIELGQISALLVMLLLIAAWRKSHAFQTFSLIANYSLILAGGFLFLMQMHGYTHSINAKEEAKNIKLLQKTAVDKQDTTLWKDTISIIIPARGEKEYKFYLMKDATLEYAWQTNAGAELFYDFHGEPAGDTTGYFRSFKKSSDSQSSGSLTSSFEGTHGWYWKNNTSSTVSIVLQSRGEYQRTDLNNVIQQTESMQKQNFKKHDTID